MFNFGSVIRLKYWSHYGTNGFRADWKLVQGKVGLLLWVGVEDAESLTEFDLDAALAKLGYEPTAEQLAWRKENGVGALTNGVLELHR